MFDQMRARMLSNASALAAAMLAVASPAIAQTSEPSAVDDASSDSLSQQQAEADQIVVTGSRIRGAAPVGSTVTSVSADDVLQSGAVTTAQALQELPQVFNLGISEGSRGQAGGSGNATYGTAINIRGISPYATLTLVNGHRMPLSGTLGQAVDPSVIPTIALQRIEVVADGASAIYGSDAVAGVVNLILRRDFEGLEARGRYGFADSYEERQFSLLAGKRWATGSATFAYEHAFQSALNGQDRDFFRSDLTQFGGRDYRVTQCNPGTILAGGVSYAIPVGGVTPANAGALQPGTRNQCENLKDQDLIPQQSRHSASLAWQQELGAIRLSGDAYYSERRFRQRAAQGVASLFVPVTNPFFVTPPGAEAAVAAAGGLTVNYSLLNDLGPYNITTGIVRSYGANIGADFSLGGTWRGEIQGFYGRDRSQVFQDRLNGGALNAAVRSTNPQTSFNPFGGPGTPQSVLDGLNTNRFYPTGTNELKQVQAQIDGSLATLPGGDIRVALGAEYMHALSIFDFVSGPVTAPSDRYSRGTRTIKAAFIEALIPLFGRDNARPGFERLELNIAGRVEDYSDVGSTANPKIGISWEPVRGVTFRGSYGTSFRAPLLSDLQTATAGLFVQNYSDPLSPTGTTIGIAQSGGNPGLSPEEATTYSIGVDFAPVTVPELTVSATFFSINYGNQISQYLSDLSLLQRENVFASLITRSPTPAFIAGLAAQLPVNGVIPANPTLYIDGRLLNLGRSISEGMDFASDYTIPTGDTGRLRLRAAGTVFTRYDLQITPTAPTLDALNRIFNPLKFRGRASLLWSNDAINASIAANHVGGYTNDRINPNESVSSLTTIDLHFDYTLSSPSGLLNGWTVGLDVTNLFDRDPPFVNIAPSQNGGGGFDPTNASPLGRLVSFTLGKRF